MKVINHGNTQKVLRSKSQDIIFPPGMSEQPDIPIVRRYLDIHPEVSEFIEEEKPEPKPEVKKETKKKGKKKSVNKEANKKASSKEE